MRTISQNTRAVDLAIVPETLLGPCNLQCLFILRYTRAFQKQIIRGPPSA